MKSVDYWKSLLKNELYSEIWNEIKTFETYSEADLTAFIEIFEDEDSECKNFIVLALLQKRKFEQSIYVLTTIQENNTPHWFTTSVNLLCQLLTNSNHIKKIESIKNDKGRSFSFFTYGYVVYPDLVEAVFNQPTLSVCLLESAWNVSRYPWMNQLPDVDIEGIQNNRLKSTLAFLLKRYGLSYDLLKKQWENDKTVLHWSELWFLAKSASFTGDSELVNLACSLLLSQKPQFWFARELPLHTTGYYAQYDQDKEIERFFRSFNPKNKTCIEIGAFDGVHYSNTRRLIKHKQWRGVFVEPVSDNFKRIEDEYSENDNVTLFQNAVSDRRGIIDLHVSSYEDLEQWGSDIASVDDDDKARWQRYKPEWHTEKVEAITLDAVIEKSGFKEVDFISIDVEGHDLQALKTLSLDRYRPELIVIEYGEQKEAIAEYANSYKYEVYMDNGQDLFLVPVKEIDLKDVKDKLNPYFLKLYNLPEKVEVVAQRPENLLSNFRFDLGFKIEYARQFAAGKLTSDVIEAYKAHLKAFNDFEEGDGSGKTTFESFKSRFESLISEFIHEGYDPERSIISIGKFGVFMDGSHRVAAAYISQNPLLVLKTGYNDPNYDFQFFRRKNLSAEWLDFGALLNARYDTSAKTVTLFPTAEGHVESVEKLINDYAPIYYKTELRFSDKAGFNLIRQMYKDEQWLGDASNQFSGAAYKAKQCFNGNEKLRFYVIKSNNLPQLRQLKEKIRSLYQVENHSVHINDTHAETRLLCGALLNANSRQFLEKATVKPFQQFYSYIQTFDNWLIRNSIDPSSVCIDGSATLSAYGIRECADLDFLHYGEHPWNTGHPMINSHNVESQLKYHNWDKEEIIDNPELHFYFNGIKFIAPEALYKMKQNRAEGKDLNDCKQIETLLTNDLRMVHLDQFTEPVSSEGKKIIGLVPVRNEVQNIEFALRSLAMITDAIIILDDHSDDGTPELIESIQDECNVVTIIKKDSWQRDEPGDRNRLLDEGRKYGGTHFIVLDADEAFSANALTDNALRNAILSMNAGDFMAFNWIQLWRSFSHYRFDSSVWTWNMKPFVFCDQPGARYESEFIHTNRFPNGLNGKKWLHRTYDYGVLHFQFVQWHNLLVKQAWYRILEKIRYPEKPDAEINARYAPSKDETGLGLKPSPFMWFEHFLPWFDREKLLKKESWRTEQIQGWFDEYGLETFKGLDIWDIDWGVELPEGHYKPMQIFQNDIASDAAKVKQLTAMIREAISNKLFYQAIKLIDEVLDIKPDSAQLKEMKLKLMDLRKKTWDSREIEMPQNPKVSVIVSMYKSGEFIEGLLEDLANQTIIDQCEIIIIDSGSPDNESEIIERYQKHLGNIVYQRTERESVYKAWNRAIKLARGKYLTNANTDDRHSRDAFEKLSAVLDKHPEFAIVYPDVFITEHPDESVSVNRAIGKYEFLEYDISHFLNGDCFVGPIPMWRNSLHDKYGLFDEFFVTSGDYELWTRIATEGEVFKHYAEILGIYQKRDDSIEHRNSIRQIVENALILSKYKPEVQAEVRALTYEELALRHEIVNKAIDYFKNKEYDLSINRLCDYLVDHEYDIDFKYLLSLNYTHTNQFDKAVEAADSALTYKPESLRLLKLRTVIAFKQKDLKSAEKYLERQHYIEGDKPDILGELCHVKIELAKTDEAKEVLKKLRDVSNDQVLIDQLRKRIYAFGY